MFKLKNIIIITTTRADYGLLSPLIRKIKSSAEFNLKIIATGSHLLKVFGLTYKEIEKDGFLINKKIDMLKKGDSSNSIIESISIGLTKFAKAFDELKPDLIFVLGDRFELLSPVISAAMKGIPIAHLHGGEATFGAIDEAVRHAITKFSHFHFTSTESYRKRVIQLGEDPKRVFNVGALGIDNIKNMKMLLKDNLEKDLNIKLNKKTWLITYHPETLDMTPPENQFKELLKALNYFKDVQLIFTKSNADAGGRKINSLIDNYAKKNNKRAFVFASLGQLRYLSLLKYVSAVIGNSSSGIIEVPSFNIPTINIGERQAGRIKAKSVIDVKCKAADIISILKIIEKRNFKNTKNPYGNGITSDKILKILLKLGKKDFTLKKTFHDLKL